MAMMLQAGVSPIKEKEGENGREVGWGGVSRQVKDKQDENAAGGWNQVVQLRRQRRLFRAGQQQPDVQAARTPHHVPHVVGQPVNDGIAATHELQVLGLGGLLRHQENHKAGGHKRHGHDDEDGDDHVCALQPGHTERGEPPHHGMGSSGHALVPQRMRLDSQVVQGQTGTGSVHWVVYERDPCHRENSCQSSIIGTAGPEAPPPPPSVTVGSGVALGRGQVGPQDGIVEDVEVRRHAVVAFVVVQHLNTGGQQALG